MTTEQIVENLSHILLSLEFKLCNVVNQKLKQVVCIDFLSELSDCLWNGIVFCLKSPPRRKVQATGYISKCLNAPLK